MILLVLFSLGLTIVIPLVIALMESNRSKEYP